MLAARLTEFFTAVEESQYIYMAYSPSLYFKTIQITMWCSPREALLKWALGEGSDPTAVYYVLF